MPAPPAWKIVSQPSVQGVPAPPVMTMKIWLTNGCAAVARIAAGDDARRRPG